MSGGTPYTLDDDKSLLILVDAGNSREAIAEKLDRSVDSISNRLSFLRAQGIKVPKFQRCTHLEELRKFAETLPKGKP